AHAVAGRALEVAAGRPLVDEPAQLRARFSIEAQGLGDVRERGPVGSGRSHDLNHFFFSNVHLLPDYLNALRALSSPPTRRRPSGVMKGAESTSPSKVRNHLRRPSGSSA